MGGGAAVATNAMPASAVGDDCGGAAVAQGSATCCYGYSWASGDNCYMAIIYPTAADASATGKCFSRDMTTNGTAVMTATTASAITVASYTGALTTALNNWDTQN